LEKYPLVSVLLCVYNEEKYILKSINSILEQTYTNWELIIIDDGSTDSTSDILLSLTDPRIYVLRQNNMGLTRSLNTAAKLAKGSLLARQDADDISHKDRFQLQVKLFQNNPDVILASTDTIWIDQDGAVMDRRKAPLSRLHAIKKMAVLTNPYVHGSLMFQKIAFDAISGYNEDLSTTQDFDLIIRMSSLKRPFAVVPEELYCLRVHKNTITANKWIQQIKNTMHCARLINRYYPHTVSTKTRITFMLKKTIIGCLSMINPEIIYRLRKIR